METASRRIFPTPWLDGMEWPLSAGGAPILFEYAGVSQIIGGLAGANGNLTISRTRNLYGARPLRTVQLRQRQKIQMVLSTDLRRHQPGLGTGSRRPA